MPDFTLADILGAQVGAPGPVYEGGPTGNVRPGDVLTALGLGGPSWLDRAQGQTQADIGAYQRGGVPGLLADSGQTADLAGGFGGTTTPAKGIRAYHGSPYDFDKFDLSKIGTGEGAQAKGYGFYFAENPAVAQEYKKALAGDSVFVNGQHVGSYGSLPTPEAEAAFALAQGRSIANIEQGAKYRGEAVAKNIGDAARRLIDSNANIQLKPGGKMYEVNINAKPEQFLDWDKPLQQQPAGVHPAFESVLSQGPDSEAGKTFLKYLKASNEPISGSGAYRLMANELGGDWTKASGALNEAGIPGIRYLDQGSRITPADVYQVPKGARFPFNETDAGKWVVPNINEPFATREAALAALPKSPTSNYVVFNPDIIDILKKYGLAGLTMGGVLQAQMQPQPQQ